MLSLLELKVAWEWAIIEPRNSDVFNIQELPPGNNEIYKLVDTAEDVNERSYKAVNNYIFRFDYLHWRH